MHTSSKVNVNSPPNVKHQVARILPTPNSFNRREYFLVLVLGGAVH